MSEHVRRGSWYAYCKPISIHQNIGSLVQKSLHFRDIAIVLGQITALVNCRLFQRSAYAIVTKCSPLQKIIKVGTFVHWSIWGSSNLQNIEMRYRKILFPTMALSIRSMASDSGKQTTPPALHLRDTLPQVGIAVQKRDGVVDEAMARHRSSHDQVCICQGDGNWAAPCQEIAVPKDPTCISLNGVRVTNIGPDVGVECRLFDE